jgi:hypothetical protein
MKIHIEADEEGPENLDTKKVECITYDEALGRAGGLDTKKVECITYDEALGRAGGFGLYQKIIFFTVSMLANYG